MAFLQQVSLRTRVYAGQKIFIMEELHRRWMARNGKSNVVTMNAPARFPPPAVEMPDNAVFVSYAREDLARSIKRSRCGSTWSGWSPATTTIGKDPARNIGRCAYFIPVVSATERRLEAYFRREWSYAIDRTRNMGRWRGVYLACCDRWHQRRRRAGAG